MASVKDFAMHSTMAMGKGKAKENMVFDSTYFQMHCCVLD